MDLVLSLLVLLCIDVSDDMDIIGGMLDCIVFGVNVLVLVFVNVNVLLPLFVFVFVLVAVVVLDTVFTIAGLIGVSGGDTTHASRLS